MVADLPLNSFDKFKSNVCTTVHEPSVRRMVPLSFGVALQEAHN